MMISLSERATLNPIGSASLTVFVAIGCALGVIVTNRMGTLFAGLAVCLAFALLISERKGNLNYKDLRLTVFRVFGECLFLPRSVWRLLLFIAVSTGAFLSLLNWSRASTVLAGTVMCAVYSHFVISVTALRADTELLSELGL